MAKRTQRGRRRAPRSPAANLLTDLLLILPLLVVYEVGVLFTDAMNGADFLTRALLGFLGRSGFLVTQAALAVAVTCAIFYMRKKQRFQKRHVLPVLAESVLYAVTMGTLIVFVMVDLLGIDPRLNVVPFTTSSAVVATTLRDMSLVSGIVLSVGAGVYEEIVFRLALVGGAVALSQRLLGMRRWTALTAAIFVSSVLFAAAHHVGALGDPLSLGVFVYRAIAGVLFSLIYVYRGLARAVYTHTFYDLYVVLIG